MQVRAAAAITASGEPPIPRRMSAAVSSRAVEIAPATSPSRSSEIRPPARRTPSMYVLIPGTIEDQRSKVVDVLSLGLGHLSQVLLHRGLEIDRSGRLGADGDLVHVDQGCPMCTSSPDPPTRR